MKKSNLIKNPARNLPDKVEAYVPQYRLLGIEPTEYSSSPSPTAIVIAKGSSENPRLPRSPVRQPYAEAISVKDLPTDLPNIGNNVEHVWSTLDGEVIDDISEELDPEAELIDNNEFVSPILEEAQEQTVMDGEFPQFADMMQAVDDGEYLLLVRGVAISKGSIIEIETMVQDLLFGTHEICDGKPFPAEEVLVIRKIPIKVGVFLG